MRLFHTAMRRSMLAMCAGLALIVGLTGEGCPRKMEQKPMEKEHTAPAAGVRVTVLYDNNEYNDRLETAWGFGCLIEGLEKTILFDTGGNSRVLLSNMQKLGLDPEVVDIVVISHAHGDHVGGLAGFLEKNSDVTVYLGRALPEGDKQMVKDSGAELVEVHEPAKVCDGARTTGELGSGIKEQSLLVETPEGMVLITGCAHPGIAHITRQSERQIGGEVFMAMGGFHLTGSPHERIQGIIREMENLGVQAVAPCHCSGDTARRLFKEAYGDNCYSPGVGWKHEFVKPDTNDPETL